MADVRIAIIGQSAFSADFLKLMVSKGHTICGVFTPLDDPKTGREDTLASTAKKFNLPVFKVKTWRLPKETVKAIPEIFEQYKSVAPDLNVLPYCNQFIPMEVIEFPRLKSINYHPSLLPRHRGAAAINWTLIEGDREAGLTIFWTDDGLDTGPILMRRACTVLPNDTVDSLYSRFLYPEGIKALEESVNLIKTDYAPRLVQPERDATYDPILRGKDERTMIDFSRLTTADQLHNFIRGMDKVPGAWAEIKLTSGTDYERVKLFTSTKYPIEDLGMPDVLRLVNLRGLDKEAIVHSGGLLMFTNGDGRPINVEKLQLVATGKMIRAATYGSAEANRPPLVLSEEEQENVDKIKSIWAAILSSDNIVKSTDFFFSGAGSMDVTRLVEEVKDVVGDSLELDNEDVYMNTQFEDFVEMVVRRTRGESSSGAELDYEPVRLTANKLELKFPNQLFINNKFVNSVKANNTMPSINPTTEESICEVQVATKEDVDKAVKAAKLAFHKDSEWRKMNPRDRGYLLNKLADLMEENKKELATLESLDSGAVYTLALKTHIGMSIAVFRYYAGWCDKLQGDTIPINNARPNENLCLTFPKPIGVCGIITPWNYPLMMVAWKSAACLAAGNTLVLKPAQACPLTALKWAELVARAGFPPGVVNVVPGKGSECGQAILDHPDIKKVGFTGSTPTGKRVMESCSKTLKKCSLELGGKSPFIIFADCDFQRAVRYGMSSVFFNKGENCIAAGRLFVEESIHDEFVAKVVEETKKMTIDDPLKRSTAHGPQNHLKHLQDLEAFCKRGVEEGATLVYGGRRVDRKGYFFMPTIFTDVTDDMFIAKEESFGPIMIISKFANGDIDGVVARANRTDYGLASGVMTADMSKALRVMTDLDAGTCFVNTYNKTDVASPFGGFNQSGFGKDLGQEALREYTKTKSAIIEF
uniref:10-formyltetrahydrofolate dehydrogenase n=1 Tax=Aceria tosichella TaxID=561515 RepID=A0A6G1SL03_9ACAR